MITQRPLFFFLLRRNQLRATRDRIQSDRMELGDGSALEPPASLVLGTVSASS